jgi:phage terminase large subunit-like protein
MIETTIGTIEGAPAVRLIHASLGKAARAEPISAQYERGLVHHVGYFPQMEDEMCTYLPGRPSPNRLDALVYALTELMLGTVPPPAGVLGEANQAERGRFVKVPVTGSRWRR